LASRLLPALALLSGGALAGCEDCKGGGSAASDAGGEAAVEAAAPATKDGGVMNVTPVPTAAVEDLVNPERLPPYAGPTGSVEGTIRVTGDPALVVAGDFSKCGDAEKTWGHAFREGPPGEKGARPLADAIVVVTGYKGFFLPERLEAKEVRIEGCAYTTRTATMTFGQRIEVKNVSKDFWTPVLEPGTNMVLMMATPNGDPAKIYPKKPGHYLLTDRDRKYAIVDVYAFLHPLHTASDLVGHYRIDGLPVGKVKVSTTHPQIDASAEAELTVQQGLVQTVDLVLKNVNKDAGAPADAGHNAGDAGGFHPILR
jgi:hypothetical protein